MGKYLFRMLLIVEPQASHRFHVVQGKRCQEKADVFNLVGNIIFSEDLTTNDLGLLCFGNICYSMGKNCISVIGSSVLCKESNESLEWGISEMRG
jgi:hypothetical protein